ncbi:MAG: MGDG synthase family glycosyltransferase [Acidimicrobiales bacterium]
MSTGERQTVPGVGAERSAVATHPYPARVLILSAEMGEGHNAAADALTTAIAEVWPGCEVERFDTLELRGLPFARAASWGYGFQMKSVPSSYEVFYDWLCRSDRFAGLTKKVIGSFFGRSLEGFVAERRPELIISTYPFGSAALEWLREHRGSRVPTVTYIPALHVHPLWAYAGIDQTYVMYDTAHEHARTPGFEARMRIGAPPVLPSFGTVGKDEARRRLGLDGGGFVVLVTGGAWGLGGIDDAVGALVGASAPIQVLAVCGKNPTLAADLRALGQPRGRLVVFDYVDNMHELMAAADVVVTNGAGVTVLEALRTPRPTIAFNPLAGHGKASTAEMIRRDLALAADDVPALVAAVQRLATDPALYARMEQAGRNWVEGRDLRESVRAMTVLVQDGAAAGGAA